MSMGRRVRVFCFSTLFAVLMTLAVGAAPMPQLILVYAEDAEQVTLTDATGTSVPVSEGMTIGIGLKVRTKASSLELRLEPNGSVLKLARNTLFEVKSLQGLYAASNSFEVLSGKIRLVAAKLAGVKNLYNVITPTAQAGVRGTDFAVEANAEEGDWVCVKEGTVEFAVLNPQGAPVKSILVSAGEFANAKAATFAPRKASPADLADKFEGLEFVNAKEADVPGHEVP